MLQRRKRDHFGCLLQRALLGLYLRSSLVLQGRYPLFTQSFLVYITLFYLKIRYQGHVLATELVARGLQTTVITDSAVFAMISRVNMV